MRNRFLIVPSACPASDSVAPSELFPTRLRLSASLSSEPASPLSEILPG